MSKDNKASQPKYSLEFKQDAARLVLEKGYSDRDRDRIPTQSSNRQIRKPRIPKVQVKITNYSQMAIKKQPTFQLAA